MPLLLVRHAHARSRKEWSGGDLDRPLSGQGLRQAEGLVLVIEKFAAPVRALSSPYLRCLQTMTPLAGHHGLDVELAAEVGEGGPSAAAVDLVRDLVSDETIVVCTHGDVIAEVLVTLADEDRVDLGAHPRQAKGSVWALEGGGRKFVHAEYFPPAVPGPA